MSTPAKDNVAVLEAFVLRARRVQSTSVGAHRFCAPLLTGLADSHATDTQPPGIGARANLAGELHSGGVGT